MFGHRKQKLSFEESSSLEQRRISLNLYLLTRFFFFFFFYRFSVSDQSFRIRSKGSDLTTPTRKIFPFVRFSLSFLLHLYHMPITRSIHQTPIPSALSIDPEGIGFALPMDASALLDSLPPLLPLFLAMFLAVYLAGQALVFRGWSPKARPEASSCLISLAHGTPAVVLASLALLSDPSRGFSSPNTKAQDAVLEFSSAYFFADLLHYVVFYPKDLLFIGHHLATLFVFLTCRYLVRHGAFAILVLLILAEVTSAGQNAWTLAGVRRRDSALAAKVFDALSAPFYSFYSVVRGLVGPLFLYKMGVFYASGGAEGVIPKWAWVSWLVVVSIAIGGSILWVSNLWAEFFRERSRGRLEKKSR